MSEDARTVSGVRGRAFEVRLHGRGGQGIVTAAELLSVAGFLDGLEAQAFPMFGSERMGAPVMAFCRLAMTPIHVREPVLMPDAVVIADATLLKRVDVLAGLRPSGFVIINSTRSPGELGLARLVENTGPDRVVCVPASDIAREHLGRPLPNICLLGAFVASTGAVSMTSLAIAVRERFRGDTAETNIRAAKEAWEHVKDGHRA